MRSPPVARAPAAAAAAIIAMLALSACGSTSVVTDTQATTSVPSAASSSSAGRAPSATSTSSTTSTSSSSTAGTTSRCTAARLSLSFLGQQGGLGHGELGFALRNTEAGSCRTFGYPGVQFLSASGRPLPTLSTRTTHDFFGSTPATALVVAPGSSVSFRLGVTHGLGSSAGCVTAAALQVIPPDDTATLHVQIPNGAYECRTATVSPLRPGNSAFP